MAEQSLVYVADPMCSWCWGFSPVIASVVTRFGEQAPVTLILGGLAPGASRLMDDANKAMVREHWDHVHEATGQPFDYGFFEREDFVYDTEPPCRAVVVARRLAPERAVIFLNHLHAAFYRDNRNVTDAKTLCDLASGFGFDRDTFAHDLASESARQETRGDFEFTRRLGISGFPALVGFDGESLTPITVGYRPWEQVESIIDAWSTADGSPDA